MNDDWKFLRRFFLWLVVVVVVLFVIIGVLTGIGEWTIHALWAFVSGWATYPFKIGPQVNYNLEMILCGVTALALAMYFAHRFLKWMAEQIRALPTPWSFKYTSYLSFLLLSMFGTSIAMTGIIHQTAWLASSEKITRRQGGYEMSTQRSDARNLYFALITYFYESETKTLPASLSEFINKIEDNELKLSPLCFYRGESPEPWLYPGAGRNLSDEDFPVLISPRPGEDGGILILWSNGETKFFKPRQLPPEIAAFFE